MLNFKLSEKAFKNGLRAAFLGTRQLRANQSLVVDSNNCYIVLNPPAEAGLYLISYRIYRDGRKHCLVKPVPNIKD